MTTQAAPATRVMTPAQCRKLTAFGDHVTVLLDGQTTGGQFTMVAIDTPPAGGPPVHRHHNEDEWFYPLEGRYQFYRDGQWLDVPVGGCVYSPRGVWHTFRNAGDTTGRMIVHMTPSGFEHFFEQCADEWAKAATPEDLDMPRVLAISAAHGIEFMPQ